MMVRILYSHFLQSCTHCTMMIMNEQFTRTFIASVCHIKMTMHSYLVWVFVFQLLRYVALDVGCEPGVRKWCDDPST